MKLRKVYTSLASMVLCLCLMMNVVSASGSVVDGSVLTDAGYATSQVFLVEDNSVQFGTPVITAEPVTPILGSEQVQIGMQPLTQPYGTYLAEGGCTIVRLEDNIAGVEGYTNCYRQAETVYLGIYMDRLENGSWHTVWYKDVYAEDAYSLSYSVNVLVKEGYYYRLRAAHMAQNGNVREGNTSATNGIAFGNPQTP